MKKKIAGVLTTVLAASLFVGGNVPVTTQHVAVPNLQQLRRQLQQQPEQPQKAAKRAKLMRRQKQPAGIWML